MEQDQLRQTLLDLFPQNETFVDEFLARVDGTNEIAMTRIARATTTTAAVEETVVEEVVEVVDEETVVEEVVEETEDVEFVLDESFVSDLVGSEEFRTALSSVVNDVVSTLRAEFEQRFRSLNQVVVEQQEIIEDMPARTKRAVVSYRPTTVATTEAVATDGNNVQRTYQDVAQDTISEIFGN